ncbi:MAG: pseudouridine-5'-phosphate glycosidase [Gemmatimonadota bacterium]
MTTGERARVALETAFLTSGLPTEVRLAVAEAMATAVSEAGASPAFIGVLDGDPIVGLESEQLVPLADSGAKLSTRELSFAIAARRSGGTTVAATLFLAHRAGIAVMATGGIGGVHRGTGPADVSTDLLELSRTIAVVVCSGAKAILDLSATVEKLETLGVACIGLGTDEWPAFWTAASGIGLGRSVDDVGQIAAVWHEHLRLSQPGALLVCVPPPTDQALTESDSAHAIERALAEAATQGIAGPSLTPFLLDRVVVHTEGRSLAANRALLVNNARVAASIARVIEDRT